MEGACSYEAMAKTKANAQCNSGNLFGASAGRVGPEGKCNRKGAIAISVRSAAKKERRGLRFEEANVGTEDNMIPMI